MEGDLESVKSYSVDSLSSFGKLKGCTSCNSTPLHMAARNNHLEVVKYLVNQGVDVNKTDVKGNTALHEAYPHRDIVKYLIHETAICPDIKNIYGHTALYLACGSSRDDVDVVRTLVSGGANLLIEDDRGNTPLSVSVSRGGRVADFIMSQMSKLNME